MCRLFGDYEVNGTLGSCPCFQLSAVNPSDVANGLGVICGKILLGAQSVCKYTTLSIFPWATSSNFSAISLVLLLLYRLV